MLGNIKKSIFAQLLVLALFIISCGSTAEEIEKETDIEILTGSVIESSMQSSDLEKIASGCAYENGSICETECCYFNSECGSFRGCDLASNEWLEIDYLDAECSSECKKKEIALKEEITEEDKERTRELIEGFMHSIEQKAIKVCSEGWICANTTWRAYMMADCTLLGQIRCEHGCLNSKCAIICDEGDKKCKGDRVIICESENEWETLKDCENGCNDGECIEHNEIIEFQNTSQKTENNESLEQNEDAEENPIPNFECGTSCIKFKPYESNFTGTVNCANNILEEYVTFKNECSYEMALNGWNLSDKAGNTMYLNFTLNAGSSIKIVTGKGSNTESKIFWGKCAAIWNNDGDNIFLHSNQGDKIMEVNYGKELIPKCIYP